MMQSTLSTRRLQARNCALHEGSWLAHTRLYKSVATTDKATEDKIPTKRMQIAELERCDRTCTACVVTSQECQPTGLILSRHHCILWLRLQPERVRCGSCTTALWLKAARERQPRAAKTKKATSMEGCRCRTQTRAATPRPKKQHRTARAKSCKASTHSRACDCAHIERTAPHSTSERTWAPPSEESISSSRERTFSEIAGPLPLLDAAPLLAKLRAPNVAG